MIKVNISNTDEAFAEDTKEYKGVTVLTVVLNADGITADMSGYVTDELISKLKKDMPNILNTLAKNLKKENK